LQFYVDLFRKVRQTPEWTEYMKRGAYNQTFMTGKPFNEWLSNAEQQHEQLMKEAGFLAAR
jgi:tripartite-type tricarboxylate transporter receptor subunit TctC